MRELQRGLRADHLGVDVAFVGALASIPYEGDLIAVGRKRKERSGVRRSW